MNPTLRVLLVVVFTACGCGFVPVDEPPLDFAQGERLPLEDSLVEVQVGAIGHCTRSRLGRVECQGTGDRDPDLRFTLVESGARSLSVGGSFGYCGNHLAACALMDDDRIVCGTEGTHVCPSVRHEARIAGTRAIALGTSMACALNESGEVGCSDERFEGALRPIRGMANSVALSCGGDSCCSVHADGDVSCLESGQLDSVRVALVSRAVAVTVGGRHACAQDANGRSACWNAEGALRAPEGARQISAGGAMTCSLDTDGLARCVKGDVDSRPFDQSLVQLDVGAFEVCGVTVDGALRCFFP